MKKFVDWLESHHPELGKPKYRKKITQEFGDQQVVDLYTRIRNCKADTAIPVDMSRKKAEQAVDMIRNHIAREGDAKKIVVSLDPKEMVVNVAVR